MPWLPHDGFIASCEVCDNDDLFDTDDQSGFEGVWVIVCASCDAVYDRETGQLLAEGNA